MADQPQLVTMSLYGHWRDHRDDGCVIHLARLGVVLGVIAVVIAATAS